MEQIQLIFNCVFLFRIVQCTNSTFNGLVSFDLSLWNYYEKLANDLLSEHLSGTQFCESILLPTENTLQATLFSARNESSLDEKSRLDSCCRSLNKCDEYKLNELNGTNNSSILHCNCVMSFRTCLKKLNTSLSSDLAFIHSINATNCYAKDYPIVKCTKQEELTGSASQQLIFTNLTLPDTFFNRCTKYEFDENQPKKLQIFDLPFIFPGTSNSLAANPPVTNSDADADEVQTVPTAASIKFSANFIKRVMALAKTVGCEKLLEIKSNREQRTLSFTTQKAYELLAEVMVMYCEDVTAATSMDQKCQIINIDGGSGNNVFNFH